LERSGTTVLYIYIYICDAWCLKVNRYIGQDIHAKVGYVVRALAQNFPFGTADGSDIWRTETQEVKVKTQ